MDNTMITATQYGRVTVISFPNHWPNHWIQIKMDDTRLSFGQTEGNFLRDVIEEAFAAGLHAGMKYATRREE